MKLIINKGLWRIETKHEIIFLRSFFFGWSKHIQNFLYKKGIYWHNWLTGECTPNFECCKHNISKEYEQIFKDLCRAKDEQLPIVIVRKK